MRASKYNYILPYGDQKRYLFFNGITEKFFFVPTGKVNVYRAIINHPDDAAPEFQKFLERMMLFGFVVDDDLNEMDVIKSKFDMLRMPNQYYLMVLPTYQCNLRCWYCVQKHEDLFMSKETVEKIKSLIIRKLSDETINELHLSWFGGEPLLAYDIVLELTKFAKEYALSLGKKFSSVITTNGTLLTPSRIDALRDAGVVNYQITIDGDRETHNSVKELGEISAYDRTLENIQYIARNTHVNLRFNYTHENLKPKAIIDSLKSKLDLSISQNINFTIYKVWQEDERSINKNDVKLLFNLCKQNGLHPTFCTIGLCYAEHVNYDFIFPNGKVGKCDNHHIGDLSGNLQSDGTILWDEDMQYYFEPHLFDGLQNCCKQCKYLPVCWGPCVAKRELLLRENKELSCKYIDRDSSIKEIIFDTCISVLQQEDD